MKMYKIRWMFALLLFAGYTIQAQEGEAAKKAEKALQNSTNLTWEANQELTTNDFTTAESNYRRAISKSEENIVAPFNLGTAYYNRESFGEAFGRFKQAGEKANEKPKKHKAFHNMGNVFMKNKEYQKAVEAYKEALRNNPTDEETRYNLALAKKMLEKEQNEQQNDQNQDNQDNQDQQDQNQDQNNEGDNQKENEGEQNDNENKDKGDQGENGENKPEENQEGDGDKKKEEEKKPNQGDQPEEQKQQPKPNQLSKQQIQNLLEAMQNEEKKVQEKMEARKVRGKKIKNEKDW